MYEIYINETKLFLASSKKLLQKKLPEKNILIARYTGKPKVLLNYVDMMEKGTKLNCIYIHYEDKNKLVRDFKAVYQEINAGGGLVINEFKEILFIYRRNSWDLPKGKLKVNEKNREGAIREVEEETGIEDLTIKRKLLETNHTYKGKQGKRLIKNTHWYLMKTNKQPLIPQLEEDITKAEWMTYKTFFSKKRIVYRNILEVLEAHMEKPIEQIT